MKRLFFSPEAAASAAVHFLVYFLFHVICKGLWVALKYSRGENGLSRGEATLNSGFDTSPVHPALSQFKL